MRHELITIEQNLVPCGDDYRMWLTTLVCTCGFRTRDKDVFQDHLAEATGKGIADAILSALGVELKSGRSGS